MLQRYYCLYASRTRGIRRRAGTEGQRTVYAAPVPVPLHETRRRWAELLRRIFGGEPLECPRCGQTMRIVADQRLLVVQHMGGSLGDGDATGELIAVENWF